MKDNIVKNSTSIVYFTVNKEKWLVDNHIDLISNNDIIDGNGLAVMTLGKRAAAIDLSEEISRDQNLLALLRDADYDGSNSVTVMMSNLDHLSLTNNAIFSANLVSVNNVIVFGLSDGVCSSEGKMKISGSDQASVTPCYKLPQSHLEMLCGDCSNRDVWTTGFADVAVIKPAVLLSTVSLGFDALWMDTDIILLADPRPFFDGGKSISIQAGGQHMTYHLSEMEASQDELCTGFYHIKSTPQSQELLRATIVELALHEDDTKFGDQAAFNLVLYEWAFRWRHGGGGGNGTRSGINDSDNFASDKYDRNFQNVNVLSPLLFPGGSIYFDYHELAYGNSKKVRDNK